MYREPTNTYFAYFMLIFLGFLFFTADIPVIFKLLVGVLVIVQVGIKVKHYASG